MFIFHIKIEENPGVHPFDDPDKATYMKHLEINSVGTALTTAVCFIFFNNLFNSILISYSL